VASGRKRHVQSRPVADLCAFSSCGYIANQNRIDLSLVRSNDSQVNDLLYSFAEFVATLVALREVVFLRATRTLRARARPTICIDPAAVLFGFLAFGGVMDREQDVVSESADEVVVELSLDLLDMVAGASSASVLE
jgi:hypothetical protein